METNLKDCLAIKEETMNLDFSVQNIQKVINKLEGLPFTNRRPELRESIAMLKDMIRPEERYPKTEEEYIASN